MTSNFFVQIRPLFAMGLLFCVGATSRAQTSPPTNNLALWVRADSGVTTNATGQVEKWADQSGNANDATQTDDGLKPKLIGSAANGKPVIRFDGADDYLDVVTATDLDIAGDIASFAVIKVADYANFNSIWGKTAVNLPAPNDWYLIQGSGIPQFYRGDGTGANLQNVQGERPIRTDGYAVLGIRQAGTAVTHYLNGATNGVGEITITPADTGTALKIGSREDLVTKMKGDIAELLIYGAALSDAQVTTAINYLRNKYGITNTPPVVSISAPANNTTSPAPANVNVTVNASDPDGAIKNVTLLANGFPLGTATAAPYRFPISVETAGTILLQAVATDDRDSATTSSNITLTVTSTTTPSLNTNSHLKLWLRADQGTTVGGTGGVTAWADQSGNDNNATQADETMGPTVGTLNGKPALHFDGTDDFLDVADSDSISITGDIATFVVANFEDFGGFRAVWAKTSGNQPRPTDYYLANSSGIPNFVRGYTTNDTDNVNAGVGAAGRVPAKTPVILGVQQQGTAVTHYLNGSPFGTGTITLTPQDLDTPLKVGSRDDFATRMKGEIAELLIYDAALSSNELGNVRQYLASKYSVPVIQLSNKAPTVQISSPVSGTNVAAPGPITITATGADTDGSIARVEFFGNGVALGSDATAPYSATVSPVFSGPITITAVATDNLGVKTTSTAITVNVTGGETAPVPVAGLALWLRPDKGVTADTNNGAVTLWKDSSGNNNNAAQSDTSKAPTLVPAGLNGLPVLRFDGTDDSLEVPNSGSVAITGDITTLFVVNVEDLETYRAIWAKTAANLPAANDYYLLPNDGRPRFYHGNGAAGIAQVTGDNPVPTGEFVTAGYALAGTTATHYLNGATNGSGALSAAGADLGGPLLIGTRADSVTRFKGSFAELLIYGRALNDAELAQVESYFRSKYFGQTNDQPKLTAERGANNTFNISWPETAGYKLESSTTLSQGGTWTDVTEPVVVVNGQSSVTVQIAGTARFFRLKK